MCIMASECGVSNESIQGQEGGKEKSRVQWIRNQVRSVHMMDPTQCERMPGERIQGNGISCITCPQGVNRLRLEN